MKRKNAEVEEKQEQDGVSRREFMKSGAKTAAVMSMAPTYLLTLLDEVDPFNNGSGKRDLIVVISDLHMGADLTYAEIKTNLGPLENFLKRIETSANVKELVIAGDMVDEWFVPATVDTYQGFDQKHFVERIGEANKGVFDTLNRIVQSGIILVSYVPGNHDLTITASNIDTLVPGINQARDIGRLGLGTYSPVTHPEIAIEHGHRYNFFCAPDTFSNQGTAAGTILPPGYFLTRLAAEHVVQGCDVSGDPIPLIIPNPSASESQSLLYNYWGIWAWWLDNLPINNPFIDDIIVTKIDGFTETYSVNDLLPSQTVSKGVISVNLFDGIQETWAARCSLNNVPIAIPTGEAITGALLASATDGMATSQYFMNVNSDKRLVIFGHSHEPKIIASQDSNGEKTIYANSGTWIDHNPNRTTMNFVVVTPQSDDGTSQTAVALYNYENTSVTLMAQDSVRL